MRWAGALSIAREPREAAREAAGRIREQLDASPDLVLLFASPSEPERWQELSRAVRTELPGGLLLGCSARWVIGGGRELEEEPGVSLTAALLPGVRITPLRLEPDELPSPEAWRARLAADGDPQLLLLPDPFTFDAESLVRSLDVAFPAGTKLGGLASAGTQPGDNALFLGDAVHRDGLVGAALSGNLVLDAIVAQGCRPVGTPMFVTRSRDQLLFELDGRRPPEVLQELYQAASEDDRALYRTSLFLGIEMRQTDGEYRAGDFLIRNLLGSDTQSGALAVGASLHDGLVVQFHLRDAATSAADLEQRLRRYRASAPAEAAAGAVLFSCLGRGRYLYGQPDHDSDAFRRLVGELPLGGFFCNGEIGPVEQQTFLHGYTSAFGIFRPRSA